MNVWYDMSRFNLVALWERTDGVCNQDILDVSKDDFDTLAVQEGHHTRVEHLECDTQHEIMSGGMEGILASTISCRSRT